MRFTAIDWFVKSVLPEVAPLGAISEEKVATKHVGAARHVACNGRHPGTRNRSALSLSSIPLFTNGSSVSSVLPSNSTHPSSNAGSGPTMPSIPEMPPLVAPMENVNNGFESDESKELESG